MSDTVTIIRTAIVEDDPAALDRIHKALDNEPDIDIIGIACNAAKGMELIAAGGFDVLLCNLGLPDGSGITLIREAAKKHPEADIIVITIFADQAKVLDSIKAGAPGTPGFHRWTIIAAAILTLAGVAHDATRSFGAQFTGFDLLPYLGLLVFAALAYLLALRVLDALSVVENLNIMLENRARAASASLAASEAARRALEVSGAIGKGFEDKGGPRGHGLKNMVSRAEALAGHLTQSSELGRGTSVTPWLPVSKSDD